MDWLNIIKEFSDLKEENVEDLYDFLESLVSKEEEKKDNFGIELNCSLVFNDGDYEMGINYKDSDGNTGSCYSGSDDLYELLNDCVDGLMEDIFPQEKCCHKDCQCSSFEDAFAQTREQLSVAQNEIEFLEKENQSLEKYNNELLKVIKRLKKNQKEKTLEEAFQHYNNYLTDIFGNI